MTWTWSSTGNLVEVGIPMCPDIRLSSRIVPSGTSPGLVTGRNEFTHEWTLRNLYTHSVQVLAESRIDDSSGRSKYRGATPPDTVRNDVTWESRASMGSSKPVDKVVKQAVLETELYQGGRQVTVCAHRIDPSLMIRKHSGVPKIQPF